VIGHDKLGNIIEMDAASGKPIWWTRVGFYANKSIEIPLPGAAPKGSGLIMESTHSGIEAFAAADNNTLYVTTSNVPSNWFVNANASHVEPVFNATKSGIGNGTVTAVDLKTGKTKWVYPTGFPTWVSPLVTNGIVFAGHITEIGTPYKYNVFGAPYKTPLVPNAIIMALVKQTGKKLWQFRVGSLVGVLEMECYLYQLALMKFRPTQGE
jgi:outer membrane protein assembly factor BamB